MRNDGSTGQGGYLLIVHDPTHNDPPVRRYSTYAELRAAIMSGVHKDHPFIVARELYISVVPEHPDANDNTEEA